MTTEIFSLDPHCKEGLHVSSGEAHKDVEAIFHGAVRLRGPDRQRFLDQACQGQPGLRDEVESLLVADAEDDSKLDYPLVDRLDSRHMASLLYREGPRPGSERSNDGISPANRRKDSMQPQMQCERAGHFYDPEEHVSCPHCGVAGISTDMESTRPLDPKAASQGGSANKSSPYEGLTRRKENLDDSPTQRYDPLGSAAGKQIDPVVGWLVCVEGPDRGRDYRIRAQRNFIGRDVGMDICIASDQSVSRVNHATLIFDPRSNSFRIAPGDAHGMTYLNNESVDIPMTLKPYDAIELGPLGSTKLLFIPFCGEAFQWR